MDGVFQMYDLLSMCTISKGLTVHADFILSSAFLVLIVGAPRQSNPNYQRPAIYISIIIIILMFSALIKDFKVKNGGEFKQFLPKQRTILANSRQVTHSRSHINKNLGRSLNVSFCNAEKIAMI